VARVNAENFFLVFASKQDPEIRTFLVKMLVNPKSSDDENAEFFSALATCDPEILRSVAAGTRLRYQSLLLKNARALGISEPYRKFRNPAHVLGACAEALGEDFMLNEMAEFTDLVISNSSYAPEFISQVASAPKIFEKIFSQYLASASSHTWSASNAFASAAPELDGSLGLALHKAEAFRLLAGIVLGAKRNGFGPMGLANNAFESLPVLKAKAREFADVNTTSAVAILLEWGLDDNLADFIPTYLS
jgi:hypothetical protein